MALPDHPLVVGGQVVLRAYLHDDPELKKDFTREMSTKLVIYKHMFQISEGAHSVQLFSHIAFSIYKFCLNFLSTSSVDTIED